MSDSEFTYIAQCNIHDIIKVGTANNPFERVKAHRRKRLAGGIRCEYMGIIAYYPSFAFSESSLIRTFSRWCKNARSEGGVVLREWFHSDGDDGFVRDISAMLVLAEGGVCGHPMHRGDMLKSMGVKNAAH